MCDKGFVIFLIELFDDEGYLVGIFDEIFVDLFVEFEVEFDEL